MARVLAISLLIAIVMGSTVYMAYEGLRSFFSELSVTTSITP